MYTVILTLHSIVCVLVVLIVLVQAGRSGGFSGLFGGGGGDALFSTSSQQSGLRRITIILAGIFMLTSFFLTILSSRRNAESVLNRQFAPLQAPQQTQQAPAQDQTPAPTQMPLPDAKPAKK